MEINVNVKGLEGLEGALHTLAQVLANYETPANQGVQEQQPEQAPVQEQQPEQAPVQQEQPQQAPVQQEQPKQAPVQGAVPTSNPTYDFDQLAVAATQLMDAGKQNDVVALLGEFGVQALTALPKEEFGNFATKLRESGAKI